jgi:transcriptional regulator with XRE-family HTH domain
MTTGEKIHFVRLRSRMTLAELGERCGVKKQTILKYENGIIKNIPADKRAIIAQTFNVSEAYLLGLDEIDNERLTVTWNALNDIGKSRLLEYAADLLGNEKYAL